MTLKREYLTTLSGSDVDAMIETGMEYYTALMYPSESLSDVISADVKHFFSEPNSVKKEYYRLLQEVTDGKPSADVFTKMALRSDIL